MIISAMNNRHFPTKLKIINVYNGLFNLKIYAI